MSDNIEYEDEPFVTLVIHGSKVPYYAWKDRKKEDEFNQKIQDEIDKLDRNMGQWEYLDAMTVLVYSMTTRGQANKLITGRKLND